MGRRAGSVTGGLRSWLRDSLDGLWLLPGAIATLLALLAVCLLAVDRRSDDDAFWFAYQGGAGAARDVLSVLAASSITVAGLTFSIMIVTLQLVAGQYTPRALRTFLGDRLTQVVAGTFVGLFAYSLLVLRSVRGDGDGAGGEVVPSLAISVGIVLGLTALVLLIAFIHHMSRTIQISEISARIARETAAGLESLYPEGQGAPAGDDAESVLDRWRDQGEPVRLSLGRSGFVRAVGLGPIADAAGRGEPGLRVIVQPGDFVTRATPVLEAWPAASARTEELQAALDTAFVLGNERDMRDDALFGIRQLADIAIRALSPGVNDPTTAATCLAHVQDVLEQLAVTRLPDRIRVIGTTVVVAERRSFEDILEPVAEIASFAGGQPVVAGVVLDVLARVGTAAERAGLTDRRDVARALMERVYPTLLEAAATEEDRTRLVARMAPVTAR